MQKPNAQRLGPERRRVKPNLATDRDKENLAWACIHKIANDASDLIIRSSHRPNWRNLREPCVPDRLKNWSGTVRFQSNI